MANYLFKILLVLLMSPPTGCNKVNTTINDLPLNKISLPKGFKIETLATEVENVRAITRSENGIYYAGSRGAGNIYALIDVDNDYVIDKQVVIFENLKLPTGIVWHKGDLYFSEINRVLKVNNIDEVYDKNPTYEIVNDSFPTDEHHGWKYLKFGPDNQLYVSVGAPCNVCDKEDEKYATIMRMNKDGSNLEVYAKGIRNSVGFDFHPTTNNLFFTDNGRDWMGDDVPFCELNTAPKQGLHFGFPHCHSGIWVDDKFGENKNCNDYVSPVQNLGPHTAPLGMTFYTGQQFPAAYQNAIFIAEHGSWNRSKKIGYRISMIRLDENGQSKGYEIFAEGWLADGKVWGRPADVFMMPDGSILITDDFANAIYRVSYEL